MKTIKKLKIKDWSGYFFREMVNILDTEPEYFMINDFRGCKDGQQYLTCVIVQKVVYHKLFLIT